MKKKIILLIFLASISLNYAQNNSEENFAEKVQSIDSSIKTLYSIISGEKDLDRNWDLFKYLFKDDAEITLNIKNAEDQKIKYYLTVDEYINSYGKWLFSIVFK